MTGPARFEGSIVLRFLTPGGPVDGRSHLTGALTSDDLTVRFDNSSAGWNLGSSWSGFLHSTDNGFTLNIPQSDGNLFTAVFSAASANDYNAALKQARPMQR